MSPRVDREAARRAIEKYNKDAAADTLGPKPKPKGVPIDELPPAMQERARDAARKAGLDVDGDSSGDATPSSKKAPALAKAKDDAADAADDAKAKTKPGGGVRKPITPRARKQLRSGRRGLRRGARAVAPAAGRAIVGGGDVLLATLVAAIFYMVVTQAKTTAGVIGAAGRAVDWLSNPTTSIPYRK